MFYNLKSFQRTFHIKESKKGRTKRKPAQSPLILALFYDIEEEGKNFINVNKFLLKPRTSSNRYR